MQFAADNPLLIQYDPNNPRISQHILTDDALRSCYPHQVIVEAHRCTGKEFFEQRRYCETLALRLCSKVGSTRINDKAYRIFAFAESRQAEVFAVRFGGMRYVVRRAVSNLGRGASVFPRVTDE